MKSLPSTAVVVVMLLAATLAGCANTVRGVSTDVKQTGDAVQDAVR